MSIIEQAKVELRIAGFGEPDSTVMIEIMQKFFAQWDSGGAVWAVLPILFKLMNGKPLSPLTGEDWEWVEVDDGVLQNKRCSTVFRQDGRTYDIDVEGRPEITFPYMPGDPAASLMSERLDPVNTQWDGGRSAAPSRHRHFSFGRPAITQIQGVPAAVPDEGGERVKVVIILVPDGLASIFQEIVDERGRQIAKGYDQTHDGHHTVAEFVQMICDYAGWARQLSYAGRLEDSRHKFLQMVTLGVAALQAISRSPYLNADSKQECK